MAGIHIVLYSKIQCYKSVEVNSDVPKPARYDVCEGDCVSSARVIRLLPRDNTLPDT